MNNLRLKGFKKCAQLHIIIARAWARIKSTFVWIQYPCSSQETDRKHSHLGRRQCHWTWHQETSVLSWVLTLPNWDKAPNLFGGDDMHVDEMGGCKSDDSKNDNPCYNKTQEAHWDLIQRCPLWAKSTNIRAGEEGRSCQAGSQTHQEGS